MTLNDDMLKNMAKKGLFILMAANQNMADSTAKEREILSNIWNNNPDLNPVYLGDKVNYAPEMILVSVITEPELVFVIGSNDKLSSVNINKLSEMRGEYLSKFLFNIGNIEKYTAAKNILLNELGYKTDQIYPDMPEFTLYRMMGLNDYHWSNNMSIWYK